jgi:tetratricopeptide (TPR) repeat protein
LKQGSNFVMKPSKTPPRRPSSRPKASIWWHDALLVVLLGFTSASVWLDPGVTRPYPGLTVVLGGLCSVGGALALFFSKPNFRSNVTNVSALLLLLWVSLSSSLGVDRFRSLQSLASWVGAIGIFLLCSHVCGTAKRWTFAALTLTSVASLLSLVGLSMMKEQRSLSATFSNSDTFSVVPMIGFFLAFALTRNPDSRMRVLGYAQQVLLGIAVVLSGSRAALFGLAIGSLVLTLVSQFSIKRKKDLSKELARTLAAPIFVVIICLISGMSSLMSGRIADLKEGRDLQGVAMREDVLVHGLRASLKRPILGSGPGTFAFAYQEFRPRDILPDYIYVNVAHNDYVEVAVELGWPGFVLVMALWGLVFLRTRRLLKQQQSVWECSCMVGCLAALLAFSLLNFIISVPAVFFWEMFILGLTNGLPVTRRQNSESSNLARGGAIVLAGFGVWACSFGWSASRSIHSVRRAEALQSALRWEEAIPELDRAIMLQPLNSSLYLMRGQLRSKLETFKSTNRPDSRGEDDLRKALSLSPLDPKANRTVINHYQVRKEYAKAEEVLQKFLKQVHYIVGLDKQLVQLQVLQRHLSDAANTLYQSSPSEEETSRLLVPLLSDIEAAHAGDGVSLVGRWLSTEGSSGFSYRILKESARYSLHKNRPRVALRLLNQANEIDPKDLEVTYLTMMSLGQLGDTDERNRYLRKILSETDIKRKFEPFVNLAMAQWAIEQPDFGTVGPTLNRLEGRLRDQPKSLSLRLLVAECYIRSGKPETASEVVSKGLDMLPDSPELLARLGTCAAQQGLNSVAQGYFDQALRLKANLPEARAGKRMQRVNWKRQHEMLNLSETAPVGE